MQFISTLDCLLCEQWGEAKETDDPEVTDCHTLLTFPDFLKFYAQCWAPGETTILMV